MQPGKAALAHQLFLAGEMRRQPLHDFLMQRGKVLVGGDGHGSDQRLEFCMIVVHQFDAERMGGVRFRIWHAPATRAAQMNALTNVKHLRQLHV